MILEAIQHFLHPAPKYLKAMGYVRESIAIEARYRRCRNAWANHLTICQQLILEAVSKLPPKSSVMVLGSGGCHDVPLNSLLEMGHQLICVDIVHLPRLQKTYPDVQFIHKDLTGLTKDLYDRRPLTTTFDWSLKEKPDLVISLNLLSQLPLSLIHYAEKHNMPLDEEFAEQVMADHLDWLDGLDTSILLISDITRHYQQQDHMLENEPALLQTIAEKLGHPQKQWTWHLAPKGEVDPDISIHHTVGSWIL